MEFAKSDERSLGGTAHEILKDISARTPEVLKAHVQEICRNLQEEAPSQTKPNDASAVDNLKACAAFAKKFPAEIPQDRKFVQAMISFALYGSPPASAKHAVSILLAASQHKETVAKDFVHKTVKGFKYGDPGFVSRLAALSQLLLLAPAAFDDDGDAIIDIATKEVLLKVRSSATENAGLYRWETDLDDECAAKCWALKILANRIRSHTNTATLSKAAEPVYTLLSTLVTNEGELLTANSTQPTYRPHLRLLAARLLLKLCTSKPHEALFSPATFTHLAEVAQDALFPVRASFLQRLKKYLMQNKLTPRFYAIPFLLAFEPDRIFKSETVTWIKSRAAFFASLKTQQSNGATTKTIEARKASTTLESVFARLLSLLAHHPDYGDSLDELSDFVRYLMFYLTSVANEDNISLIFHIAQRVKGCRDLVSPPTKDHVDFSTRLYTLSDLAQLTIHSLIDVHGWSLQTLPTFTKLTLPKSLFAEITEHDIAVGIAEQSFLPENMAEEVDASVRKILREDRSGRSRKRKSEGVDEATRSKKAKKAKSIPIREGKAGKAKKKGARAEDWDGSESERGEGARERGSSEVRERRRSGRVSAVVGSEGKYAEREDEEDDAEMEELERVAEAVAKRKVDAGGENQSGAEDDSEDGDGDGNADVEMHTPPKEPTPSPEPEADEEDDGPSPPPPTSATKQKAKAKGKAMPLASKARAASRGKIKTVKAPAKPAPKVKSPATKNPPTRAGGRATRSRGVDVVAEETEEGSDLSDAPESE